MFDGGDQVWQGETNCGSRTWSGGTIGGAVFGPAGPLAARTTCSVTVHHTDILIVEISLSSPLLHGWSDIGSLYATQQQFNGN